MAYDIEEKRSADDALIQKLRNAERCGKLIRRQEKGLALDYLEGRQRDDTIAQLDRRFKNSQASEQGQEMLPVTVNLTERYAAEAASAYNKPVERYFVDEEGEETDATKAATDALKRQFEYHYDEIMHKNHKLMTVQEPGVVWFQAKRNRLRPVLHMAEQVWPVQPEDVAFFDAADQDDYEGFIVELEWASGGAEDSDNRYAYVSKDETVYYRGESPYRPKYILGEHYPNPFKWPQVAQVEDEGSGTVRYTEPKEMPGQMITFWHHEAPLGSILQSPEPGIVYANREINVALSVLFDTIRFQGHNVPVKNVANPDDPQARQMHGVRFPVVLGINEAFQMVASASNYTEQISVLKDFIRLWALSKRMSPTDFSIDSVAPASGFAKLVDSLPKLEAREEVIRRLVYLEEVVAAPRYVAILTTLGLLPMEARKMKVRVRFSDVEFPRTEDEKTKAAEREIKYNLTTPARMLSKKLGISLEEAEARIEENAAKNKSASPPPQEQPQSMAPQRPGFGFGSRIGRPSGVLALERKNEKPEEKPAA